MINPLNLYNLLTHGSFQNYFQELDSFPFQPSKSAKQAANGQSGQALLLQLQTDPVTPPDFIYLQVSFDEETADNLVNFFKTEQEARTHFKKMKNKKGILACQL